SGGSDAGSEAAAVRAMDPRAAAALLDDLADRGWPADTRELHGGWILRAAGGVTKRANSALPAGPVADPDAALDAAEAFARDHPEWIMATGGTASTRAFRCRPRPAGARPRDPGGVRARARA
ncbi:GNAT family N-acetyltransferase, cg3035/Rv0428c family, partial [Clavibacter michiganensis]|uniref:GNAT family N-acetyltransferase, cg3035/Rv0428c family n=1 Tax=Clavibacter michiganensis TaxID=28447 RepID=UPI003F692369